MLLASLFANHKRVTDKIIDFRFCTFNFRWRDHYSGIYLIELSLFFFVNYCVLAQPCLQTCYLRALPASLFANHKRVTDKKKCFGFRTFNFRWRDLCGPCLIFVCDLNPLTYKVSDFQIRNSIIKFHCNRQKTCKTEINLTELCAKNEVESRFINDNKNRTSSLFAMVCNC